MPITHSSLHHKVLRHFVDHGHSPSIAELAEQFGESPEAVAQSLRALEEYHGVVLHSKSSEIWAMHPFSASPTNFWVESSRGSWWGNCAWCSMGIVALIGGEAKVTTNLCGEGRQVVVEIKSGALTTDEYLVHFPIPMQRAWDNVVYTCSNMLLFESEQQIDDWCQRHRIPRGDAQPLSKVLEFSKAWYGRHLAEDWVKWTAEEARELFERYGLIGPTWEIPGGDDRF